MATIEKPSAKMIVAADDSPEDLFFLTRTLEKLGLKHSIVTASDGEQVISMLKHQPVPDLLQLDLKMPKMSGFEVLQWLRNRPEFNRLPVIVFSSSDLETDHSRAIDLGANEYRVKSPDLKSLENMLLELDSRYLQAKFSKSDTQS